MQELMIKIDNVSKEYKLGQIGGTTLRAELQRKHARRRGEEDPTKKIGAKTFNEGETFMALDGVSFEVKKGERVGIIGHNGAGKSTLLKLISRVTAPTSGMIGLNGRVASMLEVGTGFHGELTGRENIYMNGAILGMTKKEIDAKIEDIIDFSECRQFIDTPVKRYSSGMYVKLAFSVAAHLDSEIMIMDEVLAVGDMAFQVKCLDKMNDVSRTQGRTILYVSHNMNTIRQLCDRVIVIDHGKIVFDGDVEEGITRYSQGNTDNTYCTYYNFENFKKTINKAAYIHEMTFMNKESAEFNNSEKIQLKYNLSVRIPSSNMRLSVIIKDKSNTEKLISGISQPFDLDSSGDKEVTILVPIDTLEAGNYMLHTELLQFSVSGASIVFDNPFVALPISITKEKDTLNWPIKYYGSVRINDFEVIL